MSFLYFLEGIRNPVFDFFFSTVTHIGEETFFLAFAILFFWCINKREGYYILITGLIGTIINQGLKLAFKIERPWVKDPGFKPVGNAIEEAGGYSFPSGHTQNVAGTFGAIGTFSRRKSVRIICIAVILLVSFSRMYLGVHTVYDVVMSLIVASLLLIVLYPVFATEERFNKLMPIVVAVSFVMSIGLAVYVYLTDPSGVDAGNLESAKKNAATLFGCMLGLCLVYPLDRFFIKFDTGARWYAQIIKLAVGLGLVFAIKAGLKSPLDSIIPNVYVSRSIRYFLIVAFAGAVYPAFFKYYSKMRIKALDSLTEKVVEKFKKN